MSQKKFPLDFEGVIIGFLFRNFMPAIKKVDRLGNIRIPNRAWSVAVMDGLCGLVKAAAWVWALGCQIEPGGPQTYAGIIHGGFNEERYTNWLKAVEHPDMGRGGKLFFERVVATGGHTTMERAEVDPEGFVQGKGVGETWDRADIGSLIMSGFPVDDKSLSCVGLYRRLDQAVFSPEELEVVHVVLGEVGWLHHLGWPEDRGATVPKLSPQQRILLNFLLDGLSRKEIAAHMEISENTLTGYSKDVYKVFGVNSHAKLMGKFIS